MRKIIQVAGLAITMAVSSVAVSTVAKAQDVELRIGPDGVRPVIRDRDRDRRDMDRRGPDTITFANQRGCPEI